MAGVFLPVSKRPSFYVANRAHHADVGGMSPGSMPLAQEIFQEGIRIPPVRLVLRKGRLEADIWNLILANVRTPVERTGDFTHSSCPCSVGRNGCRTSPSVTAVPW